MPRPVPMSKLLLRMMRRANRVGDDSIAPDEQKALLSEQYGVLYERACEGGGRYFETELAVITTGTGAIAEPADQLSLVDTIELVLDPITGHSARLRRLMPQERSRFSGYTGLPRYFEMVDSQFKLYPKPPSGTSLTLRYIPQPPDFEDLPDSQNIDVITPSGLAFLLWGGAIKVLAKSSSDVTLAKIECDKAEAAFMKWTQDRAFNDPPRTYVEQDEEIVPWRDGGWAYYR